MLLLSQKPPHSKNFYRAVVAVNFNVNSWNVRGTAGTRTFSKSCSSCVRGTFSKYIERSGITAAEQKPEDFELHKCQKWCRLNDLIEVIKLFNELSAEA
jgi:hypothetical protein